MGQTAAIVTGAASGIGRATIERLGRDDVHDLVAGMDIDDTIDEIATDIDGAIGYKCDIGDYKAVSEVVEDLENRADTITLVNSAAISEAGQLDEIDPEDWTQVINTNLTGQFNCCRAVGPAMYERGQGAIVNLSSGAGQRGSRSGGVHYSASKAGIFGLTYGLAKQIGPAVRVNCVVPGLIDTPLTTDSGLWTEEALNDFENRVPLTRIGDPDEVARLIEFLVGEGGAYMTGSVVRVDGGAYLM